MYALAERNDTLKTLTENQPGHITIILIYLFEAHFVSIIM